MNFDLFWRLVGDFYKNVKNKKYIEIYLQAIEDNSSDLWYYTKQLIQSLSLYETPYAITRYNSKLSLTERNRQSGFDMYIVDIVDPGDGFKIIKAIPSQLYNARIIPPDGSLFFNGRPVRYTTYNTYNIPLRRGLSFDYMEMFVGPNDTNYDITATTLSDNFDNDDSWLQTGAGTVEANGELVITTASDLGLIYEKTIDSNSFDIFIDMTFNANGFVVKLNNHSFGLTRLLGKYYWVIDTITKELTTRELFVIRSLFRLRIRYADGFEFAYRQPNKRYAEIGSSSSRADDGARIELELRNGTAQLRHLLINDFSNESVLTRRYPYMYNVDKKVVEANTLQSSAHLRDIVFIDAEVSGNTVSGVMRDDFIDESYIPDRGVIYFGPDKFFYISHSSSGQVHTFTSTQNYPENIDTVSFNVKNEVFDFGIDFDFDEDPNIIRSLVEMPESVWATECKIDYEIVQHNYGELVDLRINKSNEKYLRKVQGVWAALMGGPDLVNTEAGVLATLGLPLALVDGVVTSIGEIRDDIGRLLYQYAIIGGVEHRLDSNKHIDFNISIGQRVAKHQPLTTGVELFDYVRSESQMKRFFAEETPELYNSYVVLIAVEAMTEGSSAVDVYNFLKKITPSRLKPYVRFRVLDGIENLDIADDNTMTNVVSINEDIAFDERDPWIIPKGTFDPYEEIWLLDQQHRLGWPGYGTGHLGNNSIWKHITFLPGAFIGGLEEIYEEGCDADTTPGDIITTAADVTDSIGRRVLITKSSDPRFAADRYVSSVVGANQFTYSGDLITGADLIIFMPTTAYYLGEHYASPVNQIKRANPSELVNAVQVIELGTVI